MISIFHNEEYSAPRERFHGFQWRVVACRRAAIEFVWPPSGIPALEQFKSDEPSKSGWTHYHKTDQPVWGCYSSHPEMAKRFAGAMSSFTNGHGNSPASLVNDYPWDTIEKGTVVDVGGSKGNVSIALAEKYSNLKFIVQDLPDMITGVAETLPTDLQSRIEFQAYDFFQAQAVEANIYLFRNIFHNWSDSHAIRILRALVPALRSGARIIVNDYLLPEPNTSPWLKERAACEMDMVMLTLFNAREREESDWIEPFRKADSRFSNVNIWMPEGSAMAIMEIVAGGQGRERGVRRC